MLSNSPQIEYLHTRELKDHPRQLRDYSQKTIHKAKRLINEVGIPIPVVVDENNQIIIGQSIAEAARQMNIDAVPVLRLTHLTERQVRTLRVAYHRIEQEADWNKEALIAEFKDLEITFPDFDLTLTGFETPEIDLMLNYTGDDEADEVLEAHDGSEIVQPGDIWILGEHRLYCGDSTSSVSYEALMADERAQAILTDPPFNVTVEGHVCGAGKIKHREFAMASGEMTEEQFTGFLQTVIRLMIQFSIDGSLHYIFMDWRHIYELLMAGREYTELKNICVWNKDNGGMGSLYRSKHELIAVFKNGKEPHVNNIHLGKYGRYRTNVWDYAGINSFSSHRMEQLAMHPTVKPVAMLKDAIEDCTKRGDIVLDPFGGSGSTLIAAEKSGRRARLIELDPRYCDVIIQRWQKLTGKDAIHKITQLTFNETQMKGENNE